MGGGTDICQSEGGGTFVHDHNVATLYNRNICT